MSADSSDSDISSDELESPSRAAGASQKRSTASLKRTGNPNEPKKVKGPSSLPLAKYKSITSFFAPITSCSVPIAAELISLPGSSIMTRFCVICSKSISNQGWLHHLSKHVRNGECTQEEAGSGMLEVNLATKTSYGRVKWRSNVYPQGHKMI